MITLTINRQDGSVYWVERFNTMNECDAWLAEEKTRPYWNDNFTTKVDVVVAPPPINPDAEKIKIAKASIKAIDETKIKTVDDLFRVVKDIIVATGANL